MGKGRNESIWRRKVVRQKCLKQTKGIEKEVLPYPKSKINWRNWFERQSGKHFGLFQRALSKLIPY